MVARWRTLLATLVGLLVVVGATTTTASAATFGYDVVVIARAGVHEPNAREGSQAQFNEAREASTSRSVGAQRTSTTPSSRSHATNPARFCSFSGETEVSMADGTTKPISEIDVGDYVLAEDPETGDRGPREVTHLWVHQDILIDLEIDGHDVATTEDHPFWNVTDSEWQRAGALDAGDLLLSASGDLLRAGALDGGSARTTTAYNLTVDDIHTYFVQVGGDEVLVHNVCPDIPGRPFTGRDAPQAAFDHLEQFSGLDPVVASNRLHVLKTKSGLGAADDVAIGRTGDVYDAVSGDLLGNLTDPGLGTAR